MKSLSGLHVKKLGYYVTQIDPMPGSLYKACVNFEIHMNGAGRAYKLPKALQPLLGAPLK